MRESARGDPFDATNVRERGPQQMPVLMDGEMVDRIEVARTIGCPRCGAVQEEPCLLTRERRDGAIHRVRLHMERWAAFSRAMKAAGHDMRWIRDFETHN